MNSYRKISVPEALALLVLAVIIGLALLAVSSRVRFSSTISIPSLLQALIFLVGTVISWYSSHPLAHYFVAKVNGIKTLYFYVGRTELRNAGISVIRALSPYIVTLGTKLDSTELKSQSLSKMARGFVLGSGAIISICVAALTLLYSALGHFGTLTIVFALLFFLFSLFSEITLSTRAGDLAKMKRALAA